MAGSYNYQDNLSIELHEMLGPDFTVLASASVDLDLPLTEATTEAIYTKLHDFIDECEIRYWRAGYEYGLKAKKELNRE